VETQELQILVVDDERDIRDGCERILTRKGYQVTKASNGEEGLKLLEKNHYTLVLLDLKMPGMDGLEVLPRIRRMHPETLVIIITGFATIETAIEAMKNGAYDFIPKPFKPDQLRIVIDRAVERKRLTDEAKRLEQERLRTLQDLDMEKSRTRTIIHALPEGVMVSTPDARVALMNPAFIRMLDLNGASKPGEAIDHYVADKDFCDLVATASQGDLPEGQESLAYNFDVEERQFFMAHSTPVMSDMGECLGAVTVLVDITELKMLDRLKSEFVSQVSHELRSPLSTIHEQLAVVLNDLVQDAPAEQQHILSRAKEKTQGLIALIGDLLDLSRIEAGLVMKEPEPVEISSLLGGVVDFLGAKAKGKKQAITLTLPETGLPPVPADPQAVESVIGNLITNAINYSGEGSLIEVIGDVDADCVRIIVKDNGFGIEERHLAKIFDKFYRVKNEKTRFVTGTGLGLRIVKEIIDSMGGKIAVESKFGEGSTFTVHLPLHQE